MKVKPWVELAHMDEAVRFFYDNAGFSFDPKTETEHDGKVRGACRLAEAEARLKAGPWFVDREPDPEPWDGDMPYDGPLWIVSLYAVEGSTDTELLGSLGSVACEADDPYMRVVAAELAAEYLPAEDDEARAARVTARDEHARRCPYPAGYCNGNCPVCGRHNAWGCGHER